MIAKQAQKDVARLRRMGADQHAITRAIVWREQAKKWEEHYASQSLA